MISKIIHQISFNNKKTNYINLSEINKDQDINNKIKMIELNLYSEYHLSWIHKNKDWKYILWNDNSIKKLILMNYSYYYKNYINIKSENIRRLFSKYIILYHYGGIYLDNDFICYQNINKLIELYPDRKLLVSAIPYINNFEKYHIYKKYNLNTNLILLSDSVILCERNNDFIGLIINKLFFNIRNNQIIIKDKEIFGSIILSKLYYKECNKEKLYNIIPHYYFIPCFSFDKKCKPIKRSFANKKEFLNYDKNITKSIFYIYFNYLRYILKSSLILFIIFFMYFIINNIN
jgi:hypothetical protein